LSDLQVALAKRGGGNTGLPPNAVDAIDTAINSLTALIEQAHLGLAGDAGITATLLADF